MTAIKQKVSRLFLFISLLIVTSYSTAMVNTRVDLNPPYDFVNMLVLSDCTERQAEFERILPELMKYRNDKISFFENDCCTLSEIPNKVIRDNQARFDYFLKGQPFRAVLVGKYFNSADVPPIVTRDIGQKNIHELISLLTVDEDEWYGKKITFFF